MRMMVYRGTGGLKVTGDGFGRTFEGSDKPGAPPQFVDFDEVAGHISREVVTDATVTPHRTEHKRIAVTWGEAIGEPYAHLFGDADSTKSRRRVAEPVKSASGAEDHAHA